MYIGDENRVAAIVRELFTNVVSHYLSGNASSFSVKIDQEGSIEVSDDGPGLRLDIRDPKSGKNLLETPLPGALYPDADNDIPFDGLQLGPVVVNALSKRLQVRSFHGDLEFRQCFEYGAPVNKISTTEKPGTGTLFQFVPDYDILGDDTNSSLRVLRAVFFDAAHLFPGLKISLGEETFLSTRGLQDYIDLLTITSPWRHTRSVCEQFFNIKAEANMCRIHFSCGGKRLPDNQIWTRSWVNGQLTELSGSHVDGMLKALDKTELDPAIALISVMLKTPRFHGATKTKLDAPEVETAVEKTLSEHLPTTH